jgi:hypothetical protein
MKAFRQYENVRTAWGNNGQLATNDLDTYMLDILHYCQAKKPPYFRWHSSGDILNQEYYNHMVYIAEKCPNTKFLCFTKMHHLDYSLGAPNLAMYMSRWPGDTYKNFGGHLEAWFQDGTEERYGAEAKECPGSCATCKYCFNGEGSVVFHKH